jgi:hypothetical protein
MKKLLLSCMMLLAVGAMNAQDPAEWTEGMDVTDKIMLGDYDGSFSGDWRANDYAGGDATSIGNYWKGDCPNEYLDTGCFAFYNKQLIDFYQVVKFPAGSYTIKLQANYREGTFADTFANWNKGQSKKYAFLYASQLAGEAADSEVLRDFSTPIASLASTTSTVQLYKNDNLTWASDASATVKGADGNDITVYAPSCNSGCRAFFDAGQYVNELNVIFVEEAYVRVGIRKTGYAVEDNLSFRIWNVIYNGPADEEAVLEAAKGDCKAANSKIDEVRQKISDAGFEGFAGIVDDAYWVFDGEIDDAKTTEELDAILASINAAYDNYNKSLVFVSSLDELINMSEDMIASTDFPGKADFQTAYDNALAKAKTDDASALGEDAGAYFDQIYVDLAKARADYLDTQAADETGAKDFTALVKHPWFVNAEYTPTQNEDGTWTLKEATWAWGDVQGQDDYTNKLNGERTDIASEVELASDADVLNQWYKRFKSFGNGWSANGYHLFYQGGLIGVSTGWNSGYDDWEGICQQLVGLPNGYYSLKGLMRGNAAGDGKWNDDNMPPYHNIFAQNSEETVVRSVVGHTDSYYSPDYGWYEWNPNVWQEHKTGTIKVDDGKLLIGGQSSMTANFTGFRLMFYGTNPPFSAMIQEDIDKVNAAAEALTFAGDKKAVADLLAQIQLPLADAAAYDAAIAVIVSANDYINKATGAMNAFTAEATYGELGTTYADDTDASEMIATALAYVIGLGEKESDTYELMAPANAAAAKYSEYLALYAKAKAFGDANLNTILAAQVAEMKAAYKETDAIQAYLDELALPYNVALFASLGAADASEAAPVNVTGLLVNPTFENEAGENDPTTGWSGASPSTNMYAVGNAELWNASAFTFSQKLVGLPAGTYELRARALYRDAGAVNADNVKAYNEAGSEEAWANHNAELFARVDDNNDQFSYIKAAQSLKKTEPSFTTANFKPNEYDEVTGEAIGWDLMLDINVQGAQSWDGAVIPSTMEAPADPFDTRVDVDGTIYWYPSSMYGFYMCCKNYPDAYANSVKITINKGETLEVGIRKPVAIGSDWVIMDDFELYYLSGDKFQETVTAIEEVESADDADAPIYNVAGQIVDESYKGIIIKNGVKSINK